jgi:putative redox protein
MISHIDRDIELTGDLDDTQRQRLMQIAEHCPVHQTLTSEIDITTTAV